MKRVQTLAMAFIVMLAVIPAGLNAQKMGPRHMEKMDKLELTDTQKDQLESIAKEHRKEMIQLRADMKVHHMELQELIEDGASESEVKEKVNTAADLHQKVMQARTMHQLEVRNLLGEEKYEMWKHHRKGKFHKMGRGFDCPMHGGDMGGFHGRGDRSFHGKSDRW